MIDTITTFKNVPINTNLVNQSELDINNKIRSNLFAWNGQFSPQFVEVLLDNFAHSEDVLVDPFVGSGTTLCEAARKGIRAYGIELNASAFHMAKTYELANTPICDRHMLIGHIETLLAPLLTEEEILAAITLETEQCNDASVSNLLKTLIVLMDLFNNTLSVALLHKKWNALRKIILGIPFSTQPVHVDMGDSRKLGLDCNEATLLITSPPYINVFNYHQKYRRSVELLGYDVLKIAKTEFGSNRKNRGNRLLTVIQYCIDMALAFREAVRVCVPSARMIYVVGRESNVLGYSFCNSELIYNIATEIFELPLLLRQERVFKNRFGQLIYEDILHFENHKENTFLEEEQIIESARQIGTRALKDKAVLFPESDNIDYICSAIEKATKVEKSEG